MQTATQPQTVTARPVLNWGAKIAYGAGEIANATKVVTFALYGLFFATAVIGLPGIWVGIVALVSTLWDAFLDPCVGYLTDGRGSFSRRYRFMLAGAGTMGVGLWAFFSPPRNLSMIMLFAWLLTASFILRTAASVFTIPYYAIGLRLTKDYQERTSVTAIRNIGTAAGTLVASSLSAIVFFPDKVRGVDPKLDPRAYSTMGLTFGLLMTAAALVAVLSIRSLRGRLESDLAESSPAPQKSPGEFFASMRASLRNGSFRIVAISFSLAVVGLALNSSMLIHYLKYYVEINGSAALGSTQAVYWSTSLLGTLFWMRFSRRFDKHLLYVFSATCTAAIMIAGQLLFGKDHLFGTGDVRPLLIGYGLAGFFGCILWFLPPSMMADLADEAELMTRNRQEGAFFGVLSFFKQVATGVAVVLAGVLVQKFVTLAPGQMKQSPVAAYRLGISYSLIPAAFIVAAALCMLRYKLTRSRLEYIQSELNNRGHNIPRLQGVDG